MSKRHLKTINAPRSWPIERKNKFWITRPNPGPHSLKESLPLGVIFTDILKHTKSVREVKRVLNQGIVLINGNVRKDHKFPMGIFDVLELPGDECYRLFYNGKGKFVLEEIDKKEKDVILFKVVDRRILKKKKLQLNFSNGDNILSDEKDIKTGDSVILGERKIKEILKFDKGATIYLTGGKHVSMIGKVDSIEGNKILFNSGKKKYDTLKKYAFVVGKDKPRITIKDE